MESKYIIELTSLRRIIGEQLSSVEFVQDYLQIRFDGPVLSIFSTNIITLGKSQINWNEVGFKDHLCSLIGKHVSSISIENDSLIIIKMDNEEEIYISLNHEQAIGPELIKFDFNSTIWWVI